MDTKPLERFATWARRELVKVVGAQASAVLASGSVAWSERSDTVRQLDFEIERHGRQHVIDKVAYTWFNRIIALRFMDARGYTDAGVVSPTQGQGHGQPEILADAKRGNLDPEVVASSLTADAILGLLDGTRHSTDAEGEAYALLLTEYCRYWHKSMPFMFEREGDYTELLVPANLLADGAILSRAREALTEEVCADVEVIGWLYQFYISERKDEVFEGFKNHRKAGPDEIPAATQLFTPHWIVRYLVENSLGRLWMLNHPESRLVEHMEFYVEPTGELLGYLAISKPEELTILDPACGSGHMLTYAFDVLYVIYEEAGYAPSEIPSLILTHNLRGIEIDPRAGALAAFALVMKARSKQRTFFQKGADPKVYVIDPIFFSPDEIQFLNATISDPSIGRSLWQQFEEAGTLGALIEPDLRDMTEARDELESLAADVDILYAGTVERARKLLSQSEVLSSKYSVVAANPPYMGKRNMGGVLTDFIDTHFDVASADLYLAFFLRGTSFVRAGGLMAQVAMRGWLHASAQSQLRKNLLQANSLLTLMPMSTKVMPIDFETAAAVWLVGMGDGGTSSRLAVNQVARIDLAGNNELDPARFRALAKTAPPSAAYLASSTAEIYFDLEDYELQLLSQRAAMTGVACKVGLQTGDVVRFVRQWYEVSSAKISESCTDARKWAPYAKAGGARRWYGFTDSVVNWADDGADIKAHKSARPQGSDNYWRVGLEWSDIGHHDIAARLRPAGLIFDVVAMSMFVDGDDEQRLYGLLAYVNSSVAGNLMNSLSSGLHYSVGYVAKLPEPGVIPPEVTSAAKENVQLARMDWGLAETSREFEGLHIVREDHPGVENGFSSIEEWANSLRGRRYTAAQLMASNDLLIDTHFSKITESPGVVTPDRRPATIVVPTQESVVVDFVSFAVGCIFGRYSLGSSGLILSDQESTLQDFRLKIPHARFAPDADNVIPFVEDGWFEDDIVERFRQLLRVAFGTERFEENLRFVEDSLGVKSIREYFISKNGKSKFYDDHVKRYKKRPIYWMFSSPQSSFNALIYMHRYTPSTVSTVLNEYLREYRAKLEVALVDAENAATGGSVKDQKETDRLRKVLVELAEYEHDVLYPLATRQLPIDLDDGVLVNYLRFGHAVKDIGLEKDRRKVEGWTWPRYPLQASHG